MAKLDALQSWKRLLLGILGVVMVSFSAMAQGGQPVRVQFSTTDTKQISITIDGDSRTRTRIKYRNLLPDQSSTQTVTFINETNSTLTLKTKHPNTFFSGSLFGIRNFNTINLPPGQKEIPIVFSANTTQFENKLAEDNSISERYKWDIISENESLSSSSRLDITFYGNSNYTPAPNLPFLELIDEEGTPTQFDEEGNASFFVRGFAPDGLNLTTNRSDDSSKGLLAIKAEFKGSIYSSNNYTNLFKEEGTASFNLLDLIKSNTPTIITLNSANSSLQVTIQPHVGAQITALTWEDGSLSQTEKKIELSENAPSITKEYFIRNPGGSQVMRKDLAIDFDPEYFEFTFNGGKSFARQELIPITVVFKAPAEGFLSNESTTKRLKILYDKSELEITAQYLFIAENNSTNSGILLIFAIVLTAGAIFLITIQSKRKGFNFIKKKTLPEKGSHPKKEKNTPNQPGAYEALVTDILLALLHDLKQETIPNLANQYKQNLTLLRTLKGTEPSNSRFEASTRWLKDHPDSKTQYQQVIASLAGNRVFNDLFLALNKSLFEKESKDVSLKESPPSQIPSPEIETTPPVEPDVQQNIESGEPKETSNKEDLENDTIEEKKPSIAYQKTDLPSPIVQMNNGLLEELRQGLIKLDSDLIETEIDADSYEILQDIIQRYTAKGVNQDDLDSKINRFMGEIQNPADFEEVKMRARLRLLPTLKNILLMSQELAVFLEKKQYQASILKSWEGVTLHNKMRSNIENILDVKLNWISLSEAINLEDFHPDIHEVELYENYSGKNKFSEYLVVISKEAEKEDGLVVVVDSLGHSDRFGQNHEGKTKFYTIR